MTVGGRKVVVNSVVDSVVISSTLLSPLSFSDAHVVVGIGRRVFIIRFLKRLGLKSKELIAYDVTGRTPSGVVMSGGLVLVE